MPGTESHAAEFPAYETLRTATVAPHVLQVTLHRPQVGNALNTQMGLDLLDLWRRLTEDAGAVRCVVLTGTGDRIFCAGGDLKQRNGMTNSAWQRQHEIFERAYWTLADLPLPVIAAVNGHAYAGGFEMALCCDFIYASRAARFALTEVTLGIMPGGGGTQNLPRAIGERRAKEILMTGLPFGAEQALAWGVANEIFPQPEVLPRAIATAQVIAGNAPLSIRQLKKSVRHGMQMDLRTAFHFEVEAYQMLVPTEDRLEGVRAFNEKRKPVFRGR